MSVELVCGRILACGLLLFAAPASAAPVRPIPAQEMLCTDGMETEPDDDDLDAIAVSSQVDGGCMVPEGAISI